MHQSTILDLFLFLFLSVMVPDVHVSEVTATAYKPHKGACGFNSNNMVAIPSASFGPKDCGRGVTIVAKGKAAYGEVGDICNTCGVDSILVGIDLLKELFGELAHVGEEVHISWHFS